jgi:hypothetical protein
MPALTTLEIMIIVGVGLLFVAGALLMFWIWRR